MEWLAGAPVTSISLGFGWLAVLTSYALIFAWAFGGERMKAVWRRRSRGLSRAAGWLLLALVILAVVVWQVALSAPDGRLHMTVLDVGSGDGILIQTPSGRYVLIDGGPSPSHFSEELGESMETNNGFNGTYFGICISN